MSTINRFAPNFIIAPLFVEYNLKLKYFLILIHPCKKRLNAHTMLLNYWQRLSLISHSHY